MIKGLKILFLSIATALLLLHSFIPHKHESKLSESEHINLHQSASKSTLHLLAFIFHEYSEDGAMEQFILGKNHGFQPNVFSPLYQVQVHFLATIIPISAILSLDIAQYSFPNKHNAIVAAGIGSSITMRPPPSLV